MSDDPAAVEADGARRDMFGQPLAEPVTLRQLPLPLGWHHDAPPAEGFLVSDANREAAQLVADPDRWGGPALILTGPSGSGKSVLARQFAAAGLGDVVDPLSSADPNALFHSWNVANHSGTRLLIVCGSVAEIDALPLADLRTRLASAPVASIGQPDPCLIRDLVDAKLTQRGLPTAPGLGNYLAARIDRSYDAVHAAVAAIDAAALASGGGATIARARAALITAGLYGAATETTVQGDHARD
jgi:chromosomal replication initiation ATPase DnaA